MSHTPIIFHPYSLSRSQEQNETWSCIESLNRLYPVYHHLCEGMNGYDLGLTEVWNKGHALIICEQDLVPTHDMVANLLHSKDLIAAQAYYLHTIESQPVIAHRMYIESMATRWIAHGETQAHLIGLGLSYFSQEAQALVDVTALSNNRRWDNLDTRLSQAFHARGVPFHIQYPVVTHNHSKAPAD